MKSVVLILLWLPVVNLLAQESIVVTGNERSRESFIIQLYERCQGLEGENDTSALEQCMMNARLFASVKITKSANRTQINIVDRWTLIPIPFAKGDSSGNSYGLFVMERNFLGMGKLIVAGGSTGDKSDSIFIMYNDPYLFLEDHFGLLKINIKEDDIYRYKGSDKVDGLTTETKSAAVILGRNIDYWGLGAGIEYNKMEFSKLDSYQFQPRDNETISMILRVRYTKSNFKFYFNEGLNAQFEPVLQVSQNNNGKKANKYMANWSFQKNIIADHALQLSGQLAYLGGGGNEDIFYLGGQKGYRGVNEGGIWAKRAASLAIDYQIPLKMASYGTWTIAPHVEYGHFESFDKKTPREDSYSYGGGLYLFLKKLAIPGLGLYGGYNPNYEQGYISFFVGRSI